MTAIGSTQEWASGTWKSADDNLSCKVMAAFFSLSWAGDKSVKDDFVTGRKIGNMNYRVHLDGYDQSDILLNNGKSKRKEFYYFIETTFYCLWFGDFKLLYKDQEEWFRGMQDELTTPLNINLKLDPFERFTKARGYDGYTENRSWIMGPAMMQLNSFVETFKAYPPQQKSSSPKVDDLIKTIFEK